MPRAPLLYDRVFEIFERAAIEGAPCPRNTDVTKRSGDRELASIASAAGHLQRLGRIRIEHIDIHCRKIFILTGPNAAKETGPTAVAQAPIKQARGRTSTFYWPPEENGLCAWCGGKIKATSKRFTRNLLLESMLP